MTSPEEQQGRIHAENPFRDPPEARSPARRLRGRLPAPVTLWTAQGVEGPTGLTVSSVLVAEGEPAVILGLISSTADLYEAILESRRFLVHVLEHSDKELSERFAGLRPAPGGLFEGVTVEDSPFGPVLTDLQTRAYCSLVDARETGYHQLVTGHIEDLRVDEVPTPLVHLRGKYRDLDPNHDDL
ncbi:MAG: flavin reductase family protein [Actinomycetota bacterium]